MELGHRPSSTRGVPRLTTQNFYMLYPPSPGGASSTPLERPPGPPRRGPERFVYNDLLDDLHSPVECRLSATKGGQGRVREVRGPYGGWFRTNESEPRRVEVEKGRRSGILTGPILLPEYLPRRWGRRR